MTGGRGRRCGGLDRRGRRVGGRVKVLLERTGQIGGNVAFVCPLMKAAEET